MKQFFRTICSVVAISAMTVMFASCAKDELSKEAQKLIPGVERNISASATLPQDADKAHIDGSRKVIWDMGDELNINGTNVAISSIGPDGTVAGINKSTVHANTVSGTDHYWAVYPTKLAGAYSGGLPSEFTSTTVLTVHFPDTQIVDINATDTLNGLTYMASHAAVASGTEYVHFQMRNLGAVIELNLTPNCSNCARVDSIVFTSSNASLAGTFSVSADATNPTITPTTGSNKLVVKFRDGSNKYIDITDGKKVRVILPPLASKNLDMKIYGNGRNMEKNAASITLVRNNYYSSAITFDVSLFASPDVVGFSVAPGMRVFFSPGNLQWSATNGGTTPTTHATADGLGAEGTWRFAENQWDYVGDAAGNTTAQPDRSTQSEWIDLFGWGTSGWNYGATGAEYLPYSNGVSYYAYGPRMSLTGADAWADWGVYNAIYNPKTGITDPAGTWRTLTKDEWSYLLGARTRTVYVECVSHPLWGLAYVNGVKGLVILPDNWNPTLCPSFIYGSDALNTFTESTMPKWSEMEAVGCVFMPAAGIRWGSVLVRYAGASGHYWSTSYYDNTHTAYSNYYAYCLNLATTSAWVSTGSYNYRYYGHSVRLVKDI